MVIVAWFGTGNMGVPMAGNLVKAGYRVQAYDLSPSARQAAEQIGCLVAESPATAIEGADVIVTMLPAGEHVRSAYQNDILPGLATGKLLIDCSTIDVDSARMVHESAEKAGQMMLDAPVSGGVSGASAGTLTFMVGGTEAAMQRAQPLFEIMGATIVHCGAAGAGQGVKLCNNLMAGIQMISVSEGFALAERLGLAPEKLFAVASKSSGQCWSLTSYCPVPDLVPTSPANRDYRGGFAARLMLKDITLALAAAKAAGLHLTMAELAAASYRELQDSTDADTDFSAIIRTIASQ